MKFGKILIMGIVAVSTIILSDASGTILIIITFSVVILMLIMWKPFSHYTINSYHGTI